MTNDFLNGYTRDPEMDELIISAIREALSAHPDMRLGQIINNAIRTTTGHSPHLACIYDETLVLKMQEFNRSTHAQRRS